MGVCVYLSVLCVWVHAHNLVQACGKMSLLYVFE